MILGDATFEEVLFFFDVHHFCEPWEWVGDGFVERGEAAGGEAAVGDEVDVGFEIGGVEAEAGDWEAIADEGFFEADALGHGVAEILAEVLGPDVGVFIDEIHEEIAEDLDVVGLVAEGVAEHLADAGEFVLAVEGEDHAEEAVELSAFHDLAEHKDVLGERLLVGGDGEVDVAAEGLAVGYDEVIFRGDGRDILEHGLAFVRVDAEGGDHVDEAVCVDVFLVGMAAENELQLGCSDDLANDMEDVVTDDALGGGEVADAHFDNPALHIGYFVGAPLLDVFLHRDVLRFPMIILHRLVEVIGPGVFERQDIEEHRVLAVYDFFRVVSEFGLGFIEDEGSGSEGDGSGGHGLGCVNCCFGIKKVALKSRLTSATLKAFIDPSQFDFVDVVSTNYSQYKMWYAYLTLTK